MLASHMAQNISIEDLVRSVTPHFAYQLQFKSGEVEKVILVHKARKL
jgi:hypothetical protein